MAGLQTGIMDNLASDQALLQTTKCIMKVSNFLAAGPWLQCWVAVLLLDLLVVR